MKSRLFCISTLFDVNQFSSSLEDQFEWSCVPLIEKSRTRDTLQQLFLPTPFLGISGISVVFRTWTRRRRRCVWAARHRAAADKLCVALCRQQPSHRILCCRLGSLRRNENNVPKWSNCFDSVGFQYHCLAFFCKVAFFRVSLESHCLNLFRCQRLFRQIFDPKILRNFQSVYLHSI